MDQTGCESVKSAKQSWHLMTISKQGLIPFACMGGDYGPLQHSIWEGFFGPALFGATGILYPTVSGRTDVSGSCIESLDRKLHGRSWNLENCWKWYAIVCVPCFALTPFRGCWRLELPAAKILFFAASARSWQKMRFQPVSRTSVAFHMRTFSWLAGEHFTKKIPKCSNRWLLTPTWYCR